MAIKITAEPEVHSCSSGDKICVIVKYPARPDRSPVRIRFTQKSSGQFLLADENESGHKLHSAEMPLRSSMSHNFTVTKQGSDNAVDILVELIDQQDNSICEHDTITVIFK